MSRVFAESVEKEPFADRVMEDNSKNMKTGSVDMENNIKVLLFGSGKWLFETLMLIILE